jgi:hypothetical protein
MMPTAAASAYQKIGGAILPVAMSKVIQDLLFTDRFVNPSLVGFYR